MSPPVGALLAVTSRPSGPAPPGPLRGVALAYVFAIFPLTPAFVGFAALRPPGVSLLAVPFAAVVLAGAVAAALVCVIVRSRSAATPRDLANLRLPILAFLGSSAVSSLLGFDPATGLLVVAALAIAAAVHLAVLRDGASAALRRALVTTFLASALAAASIGLVAWATGVPAGLARAVHDRAVGSFVVPGEFAGYLVLAIAVATGVAASSRGGTRTLAWVTLAVAVPALAATYSRAGWYGGSVSMALLIAVERPRPWVFALLGLALGLEVPLLLGFSDHHNPSEEFARLPIWTAALRAATIAPLTGTGPGAFRLTFGDLRPPTELGVAFHPHSAILGTFTETGLLGVAAAALLGGTFVRTFARRLRAAHPARRPLALAIAAGLAGTAVQSTVDEIQVLTLGCWLPFMALALAEAGPGAPRESP